MDYDFGIIAKAGMTQVEYSQLVGVSRVTANMWVRGKMRPHRLLADRIQSNLESIRAAIIGGKLPLSTSVPKHKRLDALREAIEEQFENA